MGELLNLRYKGTGSKEIIHCLSTHSAFHVATSDIGGVIGHFSSSCSNQSKKSKQQIAWAKWLLPVSLSFFSPPAQSVR